uniref:Eukaryotic translation initiation factor 5B n=1 Tax=Arcella intermedia TaxID=1963864 RepID=A0A6B2L298_9EUKA
MVIDMQHGIELQTKESLKLLRSFNIPFVIALNKLDRIYGWKPSSCSPFSVDLQNMETTRQFENQVKANLLQLASEGVNAELFYKNKDLKNVVPVVPISAHTGEGIPNLFLLLFQLSQTLLADKLLDTNSLRCTVNDVKCIHEHGTILDVILLNGVLNKGDSIILCGLNGEPIITSIKLILMQPTSLHHRGRMGYDIVKTVKRYLCCMIVADGIENAVSGSPLFVIHPGDDIEVYKEKVTSPMKDLARKVDKSGIGVYVQCSSIITLESLLEYLKDEKKIPVGGIRLGPVRKIDVMRAGAMLDNHKEYAAILAYQVVVEKEAIEVAEKLGVKIFDSFFIYHIVDTYMYYSKQLKLQDESVVFPCILSVIGRDTVYQIRNPLIMGVHVDSGILKLNTPMVVVSKTLDKEGIPLKLELGSITDIERERVKIEEAKGGENVVITISVMEENGRRYVFGRHFTEADLLYSKITRKDIDILKVCYTDLVMERDIYRCIVQLKTVLGIQ